jgi:hypothetical protein
MAGGSPFITNPARAYGPKLLRGLLEDLRWSEADMRRLKLIK